MWYAQFFRTEEEAKKYQKEHGGAIYRNCPRSRTKKDWLMVANAIGLAHEKRNELPYCVTHRA